MTEPETPVTPRIKRGWLCEPKTDGTRHAYTCNRNMNYGQKRVPCTCGFDAQQRSEKDV